MKKSFGENQVLRIAPIEEETDRNNASAAAKYFDSCLNTDDNNVPLYPNTYGGCYMGENKTFVIQVTSSDLSEYQFIQDEFPCVVFEQVKYSYNYLQSLIDEYRDAYDPNSETIYMTCVSIHLNRALISVDEETLSRKANDPDSPIVFELGHPIIPLPFYTKDDNDVTADNESIAGSVEDILSSSNISQQAAVNIIGGEKIEIRDTLGLFSKGECTAGIGCTTLSDDNGLVTCGHGMKNGYKIYCNGKRIGEVTYVRYNNNLTGDFSIITLKDGFTADGATYCLPNKIRYNHGKHEPKIDDKLFTYSQMNGFAELIVTRVNLTIYSEDNDGNVTTIPDMVEAKITLGTITSGSSGGGIYHNSIEGNFASFLEFSGIISGVDDLNNPKYVRFTPPRYIINCLIVHN